MGWEIGAGAILLVVMLAIIVAATRHLRAAPRGGRGDPAEWWTSSEAGRPSGRSGADRDGTARDADGDGDSDGDGD